MVDSCFQGEFFQYTIKQIQCSDRATEFFKECWKLPCFSNELTSIQLFLEKYIFQIISFFYKQVMKKLLWK